jgi:ankyrin repeat protein
MQRCLAILIRLVNICLENNADIKAVTKLGDTSLNFACLGGHTDIVKLLLKDVECLNSPNMFGYTHPDDLLNMHELTVLSCYPFYSLSVRFMSAPFLRRNLTMP